MTGAPAWPLGWLLVGGLVAGMCWFLVRRQLAALRRVVQETKDEQSRLNQLLDVWLWRSDAQHHLTFLTPPRGLPPAEGACPITGRLLWDWIQCPDGPSLQVHLETRGDLDDIAVQAVRGQAPLTSSILRAKVLRDAQGQFAGYTGTVMTPQVRETDEAASEQASFSYTVSHDLRAPIRVVEGFARILKEDYGRVLDRVGNDHLDRILSAAARMNRMIDSLLTLSQLSCAPLLCEPVNLSQLAAYVIDDLRKQSPEREVRVDIAPGMIVQGDPTLLRVALENLLGNAWKYTSKTSAAHISFDRASPNQSIFTIRDNGAGFDMRFADRLFEVFQRLHGANDFQGTGVGLASVRRIVRRHGGDIWAQGEVNRGAQFHFSLNTGGCAPVEPSQTH